MVSRGSLKKCSTTRVVFSRQLDSPCMKHSLALRWFMVSKCFKVFQVALRVRAIFHTWIVGPYTAVPIPFICYQVHFHHVEQSYASILFQPRSSDACLRYP